jgi:NDP-sugar pyrophosphorylase family protein
MEAIILAGGFGTRLQTVVSDVPKPMAPILSKPFLAWQMDFFLSSKSLFSERILDQRTTG